MQTGIYISRIVLGNLDSDTSTIYWYCVAVVFDQMSFFWRAAIFMDLILLLLRFSERGWGAVVCATCFSVYIFVIVCIHVINISRKKYCRRRSCSSKSSLICFVFFYCLCIVLLILIVANERSSRLPTGITGLFAIGSGNLPCCVATYVEK